MKNKYNLKNIFPLSFTLIGICSLAQNKTVDRLKTDLNAAKINTARVNIYNDIANEFKESNPDSTIFYTTKASDLAHKINYDFGLANAALNRGNAKIILGKYNEALKGFYEAEQLFKSLLNSNSGIDKLKLKNGLARALASSAVVHSEGNNYSEALKYYLNALKIYLEIGAKTNISKIYNNIGIIYKSQNNNPKALQYLLKALKLQKENGEQTVAVTLTNIGVIYFESGDNPKALAYYNEAEKLFEKTDNKRGFALLNNYLGDFYKKQERDTEAMAFYRNALKLYDEMDNKFGASLVLYNLGQLHFDQRKYTEALPFAIKSLEYAKEIEILDQTLHSEKLLSEIYGYLKNPAQSLEHYKQYIVFRDSLNNQENHKKFLRAEMNFEFEKKEALLLEKNKRLQQLTSFLVLSSLMLLGLLFVIYNRMQVKRRLTLQKEVAEYEQKALHLQMNPHFVFNCLGSISSFIVQNGTDNAIKYLSKFSKLMRLTLEYSKGSLIPIDKEIESLQNYLELEQLRFNKRFEFSINKSAAIEDDMALPPLLIQPFVENAILHGIVPKEGKGKIDVHFDVQNNQLVSTITDNGIGLSKSKELKENSVTAHQSMALEITKKRLEMIAATTSKSATIKITELIDNQNIAGTKITLNLPLQYIKQLR